MRISFATQLVNLENRTHKKIANDAQQWYVSPLRRRRAREQVFRSIKIIFRNALIQKFSGAWGASPRECDARLPRLDCWQEAKLNLEAGFPMEQAKIRPPGIEPGTI